MRRYKPGDAPLCPKCLEPLTISRRGEEWFAYCRGPHGYDGCHGMGEFGESRDEAIDALYDINEIHDL